MSTTKEQQAQEHAIRALTRQNPRFALYRKQDPMFRQADVDFWTAIILAAIEEVYRQGVDDMDRNWREREKLDAAAQPQRSDQPQEQWTPEIVAEILSGAFDESDEHGRGLKAIADAHNAAVAAEYTEAVIDVRSDLEPRIESLVDLLSEAGCRLRELTRCYEERWGKDHTKDFHDLINRIDALAKVKKETDLEKKEPKLESTP